MNKTFVTLFTACENVHLTKDLGQIPYFMHAKYGYHSKIVTYKNSTEYSSLQTEVKGLNIDFISDKGRVSFLEKSVLFYIYNHAKQIDVLNLFHFSKQSFVYGLLYKLLNPKGFLFLKIDGYNETFRTGEYMIHSRKKMKNRILTYLEKLFLNACDLMSIENTEGERILKLRYPKHAHKITYLPVGANDLFLKKTFKHTLKTHEEKENIILTTGRIGASIKNHEMILKALKQVDLKDWKMVFVGPVNPDFKSYFNTLAIQHPHLQEKVIFVGEILNRIELYEWYNRAKLFCMTSWKESFSLSIAEAFFFGNYIIGTEGVMSMKDISNNGVYGKIVRPDDDIELATVLQQFINNQSSLKALYPSLVNYSHQHFVWSTIIEKLEERIQQKK